MRLRPIVARITSIERERAIDTVVELVAGEVDGLPEDSYVICHDLYTLPDGLLREHKGHLSPGRILEVERAVTIALGLDYEWSGPSIAGDSEKGGPVRASQNPLSPGDGPSERSRTFRRGYPEPSGRMQEQLVWSA